MLWFLFPPSDTGRLLRCNLFGLLIDWIRPLLCQAYGEGEKTFGEVYDFVHRNNLPVCIFRLWTWASLNFGELNLYRPLWLKIHTRKRECGPLRLKKTLFCFKMLFQTMIFVLFFPYVLCLRVMYSFACIFFFQGRVTCLFSVFFVNVLFCYKLFYRTLILEYLNYIKFFVKWTCMITLNASGHI